MVLLPPGIEVAAGKMSMVARIVAKSCASCARSRVLGTTPILPAVALAYAHGTSTVPLIGQTIGDNLRETARQYPERDALVVPFQGVRLTYADFDSQVDRLALNFLAAGIAKGDRVGIWSPNNAEWVLIQYAAARAGAILVNLNPAYRLSEILYALQQSECRFLLAATHYKTSDYAAMIEAVRPKVPVLEHVVYLGSDAWQDLLDTPASATPDVLRGREASLQFDDPVNIQYTSGTTGFPKGATLSHHNLLNNAFFIGEGCRYTAADRVCIPVPFYHCFGMVLGNLACTTHGAAIVVPAPTFDAAATLQTVQDERCTSLYGVPTMFIAELSLPDFDRYDLSSLRTGIMAGSPCPIAVMKQCVSAMHMDELTIGYGMTETSPVSTQTAVNDPLDKRVGTVGRVHPHLEVKIVDPERGGTVSRGAAGELCTRGYSVMLGYWRDPERTAEAIDAAGWMHTGDLATMDEHGYVNFVGRLKDMIIRGGENVYPREVEEFLYGHPDIVDVQVIGVPDLRYGEEIMAWVKLRPGAAALDAEALRRFCEGRIAHYKIPRYVHVATEFPMTVTGKVQKYLMRAQATELLGLQAAAAVETA
jgi:fatty-acyl-CoA synthase